MCKDNYPYSCSDSEPCSVCGHEGRYHVFRNGVSACLRCDENPDDKKEGGVTADKRKECWSWCSECGVCHKGHLDCSSDCKDYGTYIDIEEAVIR